MWQGWGATPLETRGWIEALVRCPQGGCGQVGRGHNENFSGWVDFVMSCTTGCRGEAKAWVLKILTGGEFFRRRGGGGGRQGAKRTRRGWSWYGHPPVFEEAKLEKLEEKWEEQGKGEREEEVKYHTSWKEELKTRMNLEASCSVKRQGWRGWSYFPAWGEDLNFQKYSPNLQTSPVNLFHSSQPAANKSFQVITNPTLPI